MQKKGKCKKEMMRDKNHDTEMKKAGMSKTPKKGKKK